jgi:hypothetical protein
LLTLGLFFIGVRELRYASVASFVSRQKKKETGSYFIEFLPVSV